jgi:hypothetical protein
MDVDELESLLKPLSQSLMTYDGWSIWPHIDAILGKAIHLSIDIACVHRFSRGCEEASDLG